MGVVRPVALRWSKCLFDNADTVTEAGSYLSSIPNPEGWAVQALLGSALAFFSSQTNVTAIADT
jgi:hypothetical protein